jgi:hypothetical protein
LSAKLSADVTATVSVCAIVVKKEQAIRSNNVSFFIMAAK